MNNETVLLVMKFLYNAQVLLLDSVDTIEFIKLGNSQIYDAILIDTLGIPFSYVCESLVKYE